MTASRTLADVLELPSALHADVAAHLRDGKTGLAMIAIYDHFWPSPDAQSVVDVIGRIAADTRIVLACGMCGATPAEARPDNDLGPLCAACTDKYGVCSSWPCASCGIRMHGQPENTGSACSFCRGKERWETLPVALRDEVEDVVANSSHVLAIKAIADFIGGDRRLTDAQEILSGRHWGPVRALLASLRSGMRAELESHLAQGKTNLVISTLRQFEPQPEPRVVVEAVVALAVQAGVSLVCPMCGEGSASVRDDHQHLPLCDDCSATYVTSPCAECGVHQQVLRGSTSRPCSSCEPKLTWAALPPHTHDEIDTAVADLSAVMAIVRIRELTGCGISEAVRLHDLRHQHLRRAGA